MKRELGSLATHRVWLGMRPKPGAVKPFPMSPRRVFAVQVRALAARLKAIGCKSVIIGVSGGLDSALAVLVAHAAFRKSGLDPKGIHVYTLPGFATSRRTHGNADELCAGLGLKLETISIVRSVRRHLKDIGHDGRTPDVTYENAQARMRTLILMDKANLLGGIVLGTGDLSEIALGWCTYNGDHMSMFGVNAGVPKTVIRKVCAAWAKAQPRTDAKLQRAARAIEDIIATPVSPELVRGQKTEDKLGPYELHDFFLWNFIVNEMGPKDLFLSATRHFGSTFTRDTVIGTLRIFWHRFFTQAFKRNCQPDGIRVYPFELSLRGWWIPSDFNYRACRQLRLPDFSKL